MPESIAQVGATCSAHPPPLQKGEREQIRNLKTFQLDHRIERPVSLSTRTGSVAMSASWLR